jgi:hypothetical protein
MRITTVEYRKLISGPGYNNTTIGAVATVEADETPEEALHRLATWVQDRHAGESAQEQARIDRENVDSDIEYRRREVSDIEQQIQEKRDYWYKKVLPFVKQLALNDDSDEVPF